MKILTMLAMTLVFLITAPSLAFADHSLEITADSTLAGNPGFIVMITEPGFPIGSFFVFEEAGKIRVFASREGGSPNWDILPGSQYLCRAITMSIGDTWRFLDDDSGGETVATVVAQENVTTTAGTFSTFKVDVALASDPGTINHSVYFSSGVGIIREEEYFAGVLNYRDSLFSSNIVGGSGFFPLAVGNQADYAEDIVPVEATSWGAVKSKYN